MYVGSVDGVIWMPEESGLWTDVLKGSGGGVLAIEFSSDGTTMCVSYDIDRTSDS